jgi:methyl-CpG-binding domain protein 4
VLICPQVRRVFWKLLELCPTPEAAIAADTAAIRDIIAPLGLHNKRAVAVQRLSQDFVQKEVGKHRGSVAGAALQCGLLPLACAAACEVAVLAMVSAPTADL